MQEKATILKKVAPVYPPEALDKRIEGSVNLLATVSKEGKLVNIAVVSGDPLLVPAALTAVKQWEYQPYKLNGETVDVKTSIQLNFVLPTRVHVPEKVMEKLLVKRLVPPYPQEARRLEVQGQVILDALIGVDGKVKDLTPVSGERMLVPSTIDVVRRWQYKPYLIGGKPTEVETEITVTYSLEHY